MRLNEELETLKSETLEMGGLVENVISKVTKALSQPVPELIKDVESLEIKINTSHIHLDNRCLQILAQYSPVASDLRLILAVVKMNTDLERMGDQAMNMALNMQDLSRHQSKIQELPFQRMVFLVLAMVRQSLDSFVRSDIALAQTVILTDDEVDVLKDKIFNELRVELENGSSDVNSCLDLILIARNLERMADHATNIAEDVIFANTGEDVRHPHSSQIG